MVGGGMKGKKENNKLLADGILLSIWGAGRARCDDEKYPALYS